MTTEKINTQSISFKDFVSVITHFRTWYVNSRPIALPQSILPAISAVSLGFAFSNIGGADFSLSMAILAVIGVIFGHLGSNLFDDFFDYKSQGVDYRREVNHRGMRARIHKCPYLTDGSCTINQLLAACIIFSGIAIIIGSVIWFYRDNMILVITGIAIFFGISYSGFPFKFSYHGLGEVVIGLMFGPLSMLGVFYATTGICILQLLYFAIPMGLLVTNIIYTHSILDIEADKEANKNTLAVLIGNKKGMIVASFFINLLPFVIVAVGVGFGHLNPLYLLVFLTAPMAINLLYLLIQFQKAPYKKFSPKLWMGPFEKWNDKVKYGVDWFLIRWMLARNFVTFFGIIVSIVSIVIGFTR
jgi:1,4-dihydroxy-2-naphthoate octaprenyltransferase